MSTTTPPSLPSSSQSRRPRSFVQGIASSHAGKHTYSSQQRVLPSPVHSRIASLDKRIACRHNEKWGHAPTAVLAALEFKARPRRASLAAVAQKIGGYAERFSVADNFHTRHDLADSDWQLLQLLVALGCACTLVAYVITYGASWLGQLRMGVCASIPEHAQHAVAWRYLWLCLSGGALAGLASFIVKKHPQAGGSGLPEVKETLAGMVLFDSFSPRTLALKTLALALALGSGLSIGKEGPLVHLSCAVAHQLVGCWQRCGATFNKKDVRRHELFVAACAMGVVCTFGSAVGGVIFSIEIVSTFFLLEHLPNAFFVVTWGMLFIRQINALGGDVVDAVEGLLLSAHAGNASSPLGLADALALSSPRGAGRNPFALFSTAFDVREAFPLHIQLCFLLVALLGAPIALLQERCVSYSAAHVKPRVSSPLRGGGGGGGGGGGQPMLPDGGAALLDHLFSHEALAVPLPQLAAFCVLKLTLLTPLSLTQAVPTGVFLPSFVGGAAYGRLVGELLLWVAPGFLGFARPGHFAIIGAAALTAAATGTMSTAVVCLELTGQLSLQLPILVATVAGYFAAKWLNVPSLFDVFIKIKNLPGAALGSSHASTKKLRRGTSVQLGLNSRLHDIRLPRAVTQARLKAFLPKQEAFMQKTGVAFVPVVASDDPEAAFLGCVNFNLLDDVLQEFEERAVHRRRESLGDAPPHEAQEETLDLLWRDGEGAEALGEPPREGAELAPLQISKHMRLSRVSFLFRMLGVSYSCVTERGRLLGVLTRLDVVEEEKERMSQPFLQRHDSPTVSLLGISRMSSTSGTSTSSSRTSSISLV